jgi:group I intron endonuclease
LGLFLNTFGWSCFSLTLIEQYPEDELKTREDRYLHRFKSLLNYLTFSYRDPSPHPRNLQIVLPITKRKISTTLKSKIMSLETKKKMSRSKSGSLNFYFGKRLHSSRLLAAQKARGKLIYVYNENDLSLVNNNAFISIREASKNLLINPRTLVKKLNSGIPLRGYYYSKPLVV